MTIQLKHALQLGADWGHQSEFAALHFGRYLHKASFRGVAANGRFRGQSEHRESGRKVAFDLKRTSALQYCCAAQRGPKW